MILDHVGITVSNYEKSRQFYTQVLMPLGITVITEHNEWIGFGKNNKPKFWFGPGEDTKSRVDKRIALALPVFNIDKFCSVMPIDS